MSDAQFARFDECSAGSFPHANVAADEARETLIVARTDAVAVEGFERAIERAAMYREAGADMLFVEAPRARDDLARRLVRDEVKDV